MSGTRAWAGAVLLAVLASAAGCGPTVPPAPAGTGAREAAQRYFECVAKEDWAAAYDTLAPESRARVGADRFARLGQEYRRGLGFVPSGVRVNASDEHGDEAVAHVTLSGRGGHRHQFKDAVTLKRVGEGWRVVLSPTFGKR